MIKNPVIIVKMKKENAVFGRFAGFLLKTPLEFLPINKQKRNYATF